MRISRQKALLLTALILVASWSVISCERTTQAVGSANRAADFTLKDDTGADYNFYENTKGKVVLLNFWAKRCPACKTELPNLVAMYDKYGADGLEVIGVDTDASGVSAMKAAVSQYGINYHLLTGSSREIGQIVSSLGGFRFIPTTFIINRDGDVVEKLSGPKGKAYLEAAVKKLL